VERGGEGGEGIVERMRWRRCGGEGGWKGREGVRVGRGCEGEGGEGVVERVVV